MKSSAETPAAYLESLPEDRRGPVMALRDAINAGLPPGFDERMGYGMLAWVVPHSIYPAGYHCDPKLALPFINVASQKQFVALYHMGIYADPELLAWFVAEWPKHTPMKLDMGKSCIRFKKFDTLPYDLIRELCTRMTPQRWIEVYETALQGSKSR
jgi:hypothetical protein